MKVAVCISGQPRFVERGYSTIYPYLIKNLNADVFIHTWENRNDVQAINLYKPVSCIVEPQKDFTNLNSMYYLIYEANRLKKEHESKNNFVYDWVIRARFDLFIQNFEIKNCCELSLNANFRFNGVIEDTFAVGSSRIMDIYSEMFHHLPSPEEQKIFYKAPWYPEIILSRQLKENNIQIKDLNCPVGIIRNNYVDFLIYFPKSEEDIPRSLKVPWEEQKCLI